MSRNLLVVNFLEDLFSNKTLILNKFFIKLILNNQQETLTLHFPFICFWNCTPKNIIDLSNPNLFDNVINNKWSNFMKFDKGVNKRYDFDFNETIKLLKNWFSIMFGETFPTIVSDFNLNKHYNYNISEYNTINYIPVDIDNISIGYESFYNKKKLDNFSLFCICKNLNGYFGFTELKYFDIAKFLFKLDGFDCDYELKNYKINGEDLRKYFRKTYNIRLTFNNKKIFVISSFFNRKTTLDILNEIIKDDKFDTNTFKHFNNIPNLEIVKNDKFDFVPTKIQNSTKLRNMNPIQSNIVNNNYNIREEEDIYIYGYKLTVPLITDQQKKDSIFGDNQKLFDYISKLDEVYIDKFPVDLLFFLSRKVESNRLIEGYRFDDIKKRYARLGSNTQQIILNQNIIKILEQSETQTNILFREVIKLRFFSFFKLNLYFQFGSCLHSVRNLVAITFSNTFDTLKVDGLTENDKIYLNKEKSFFTN